MKEIEKESKVKLKDGRRVKILSLPTSFMANGSYEVIELIGDSENTVGSSFWVKPEDISYRIDSEWYDYLGNYFEIIFDEEGLHIIPKNISLINIDMDRDDMKKLILHYPDTKHKTVTLYVGDTKITDEHGITENPDKVVEPTLGEKVKKVIFGRDEGKGEK